MTKCALADQRILANVALVIQGDDGVYVFQTKIEANCKVPFVAPAEDTGPLVRALVNAEPGKNVLAFKELISFSEFVEIWGRTLGVRSRYVHVGAEDRWADMPDILAIDIEECTLYIAEFGYDGGDPSVIHPKGVSPMPSIDVLMNTDGCSSIRLSSWGP